MGWRRVAEQELSLLSPETLSYLEAFSGVNAYIDSHTPSQMSLEYSCSRSTGSTTPRRVDPRGLRRLAQGDGGGTCAATWRRRSSAR